MSQPVDVSILIVSFNTREETLVCLASVYAQASNPRFEVIVVDNNSHDGSAAAIAESFPRAILIASDTNLGFAAANNLAARQASGKYLLLLNPDTVILEHAVDRVLEFAHSHGDDRLCGGRTYFADMTLNRNSCHGEPTLWSLFCQGSGLASLFRRSQWFNPEGLGGWQRDTEREVDCISGCFLLIRRELWRQLDGFDGRFFMYGEDTDLCIRARRAGASCWICPNARLIHHGGRSERVRGDKMLRLFRAKHQLFRKHWRPVAVPFGVAMLTSWALTRYAVLAILGFFHDSSRTSAREWQSVVARRKEFTWLKDIPLRAAP